MSAFKRYRDVGVVILLLAVPFFFLRANMKRPENLNGLDRVVLRISAPIEFAASSLARGISLERLKAGWSELVSRVVPSVPALAPLPQA